MFENVMILCDIRTNENGKIIAAGAKCFANCFVYCIPQMHIYWKIDQLLTSVHHSQYFCISLALSRQIYYSEYHLRKYFDLYHIEISGSFAWYMESYTPNQINVYQLKLFLYQNTASNNFQHRFPCRQQNDVVCL